MFVVVLSLSNTVLSTTYKQYTENDSVALDDDAECANFCFQGGLDYQKNSGNETLVDAQGIINNTKYGQLLEGVHKKSS